MCDCITCRDDDDVVLDVNQYQQFTETTAIYPPARALDYLINGLTSEAGEVAGKYKKIIRDKNGIIDAEAALSFAGELGDVLWYVARISDEIGWDLQDVFMHNIDKLSSRKERGKLGGSGDVR